MKTVTWATTKDNAKMGELIEDGKTIIIVKVTGVQNKRSYKLIGQKVGVLKDICTIEEQDNESS